MKNGWWRDPEGSYRNGGFKIESKIIYPWGLDKDYRWRLIGPDGRVIGRFTTLDGAKLLGDRLLKPDDEQKDHAH